MKSPLSHRKTGALDWLCLGAIAGYQRHISPRKGWRCAHARLHGGVGCSSFAREAIANYGLAAARLLIRARFSDCKKAGQILRAQHTDENDKKRRKRGKKSGSSSTDWCDCTDPFPFPFCHARVGGCADALIDCGPGDSGCCDAGDCNCSPCD